MIVLGLDGVDPQVVDLLLSEGKLPNFAKLRQGGAYGRLVSSKPLLSPIIWTTIATGKTPARARHLPLRGGEREDRARSCR